MKSNENSLNQQTFNKISKIGLLENYRKLLIKNLGLSKLKVIKRNHSSKSYSNCTNKTKTKSLSNLKIKAKKIIKYPLLINVNNNDNNHVISPTLKNSNISLSSTNEHVNMISELQKLSIFLPKKQKKKNILKRNNKSCVALLPNKAVLNINTMTNSSLNKKIKIIKESKINFLNSNYMTTAQNTFKTSKNSNNIDSLFISPPIEPNNKAKNKIKINNSTPNLLNKTIISKNKDKTKEKSNKIFNDKIINNNVHNYNHKYKPIIKTSNNSKSQKKKIIKLLDISREFINTKNHIFNKKEKKINYNFVQQNKNNKHQLSVITQSDVIGKEINMDNKNSNISKNSDDTKKESHIDVHNFFNDKIFNSLKNKNSIYDVISINMKKNYNNQNNNRTKANNNCKINQQDTINIEEDDINDHYDINNNKNNDRLENQKKIIFSNNSKNNQKNFNIMNLQIEMANISHNINNNLINYSDINEDININYNMSENNKKESLNKTHHNFNNKYCYNINNLTIINKPEEFQNSNDKNNDQTQTTNERNNIIFKFIKQPIYNISPRFFSAEKPSMSKYSLKNKKFMFINDIEDNNKKIPLINIKKILSLEDKDIFRLINFIYDNYNAIISSTNLLKNKFNNSLKNVFQNTINDFQNKYIKFLKVLNYSFQHNKFIFNHKKNNLFNLIIKCQITTKEIKKSYEIGCNYISNGKIYDNLWKFDVHNKSDIKLWICTELDIINNSYKKLSYTSQVSSFSYKDEIQLEFNIFSKGKNIDPTTIEWTQPIISETCLGIYTNSNFISAYKYDQLRACEVETQILFWKNVVIEEQRIVSDFINIFKKYFKIKSIYYDISKFYFFKFEMIANKIGILKQNKFLSFDINIIEYESIIRNEIQCIYLVNNNYYNKSMDIRLGTVITFYIIDMIR